MRSWKTGILLISFLFVMPLSATDLCGAVSGTLTAAGNPYIVTCDITLANGQSMDIEEGTELKFNAGTSFNVLGNLLVEGTEASPVVFTSNQAIPAPGNWNGIHVQGVGSLVIWHCSISYGNGISLATSIESNISNTSFLYNLTGLSTDVNSKGTVSECQFTGNTDRGIYFAGTTSLLTVSNCIFDTNGVPAYLGQNSYPSLSGFTVNPNHTLYNGIDVYTYVNWTLGGTLTNAGCPYVVHTYGWGFSNGTNITFDKGVVVKLMETGIGANNLTINGTASEPVIMTSLSDDSVSGDTNANGPSSCSNFDWYGVWTDGSVSIQNCVMRYGSDELWLSSPSSSVSNSTFEFGQNGISFSPDCTGTITGCNFRDNSMYGLNFMENGSGLSVSNCVFDRNAAPAYLNQDSFPTLSGFTVNPNHTLYNGIDVYTYVNWTLGGTLTNAGCPYIIHDYSWQFDPGQTLTIDPGIVLKAAGAGIQTGNLDINGTSAQPVIMTSLFDDDIAGDTNNDGISDGKASDWAGLTISSSTGSHISNARIMFSSTALYSDNSSCTIDGLFAKTNGQGLALMNGSQGLVRNSDFLGNATAVEIDATSMTVLGNLNDSDPLNDGLNQFVCNNIAVNNGNSSTVMAENNWWGNNPPPPAIFTGPIDYAPYLPTEVPHRHLISALKLDLSNSPNIHLKWEDLGISCGYRMFRSDKPDRDFMDISGPLSGSEFNDPGAGSESGILFYNVEIDF
jgi:hypothetical protein